MSEEYPIEEEFEEALKRNMFLSLKNAELQNKIDKAIELLNELLSSTKGVLNDYCSSREAREHNKILIELLREDEQAYIKLLETLGNKEKDIEFDVLKALNTDLPDDIEMG